MRTILLLVLSAILIVVGVVTTLCIRHLWRRLTKLTTSSKTLLEEAEKWNAENERLEAENERLEAENGRLNKSNGQLRIDREAEIRRAIDKAWPVHKALLIYHMMRPRVAVWGAEFMVKVKNLSPHRYRLVSMNSSMAVAGYVVEGGTTDHDLQMRVDDVKTVGLYLHAGCFTDIQVSFSFPEHVMVAIAQHYGQNIEVKLYVNLFVTRDDGSNEEVKLLFGEEDIPHLIFVRNHGDTSTLASTGNPA